MHKRTKQYWFISEQGDSYISKSDYSFLLFYIHQVQRNRIYLRAMQIIDLQNYKIHNRANAKYEILHDHPREQIFKFIIHNN